MYWFKKEQFHTYQETTNGVFGLFDTPEEILEAAEKTKEKKTKSPVYAKTKQERQRPPPKLKIIYREELA